MILLLLAVGPVALLPQAGQASDAYVRNYGIAWSVDGQGAAALKSWEGGDLRVTLDGGKPSAPKREDVRCVVGVDGDAAVQDWLRRTLENDRPAADVALYELARDGSTSRGTRYDASRLTEIVFPACDRGAVDIESRLSLQFAPSSAQAVANPQAPASPAKGKTNRLAAFTHQFRFAVDGLDGTAVARVSSLTVRRDAGGNLQISTLTIRLFEAPGTAGWRSWFESSVEKGTPTEKNGRLEFLDRGAIVSLLALKLEGLGILRMSRTKLEALGSAGTPNSFDVELSCRKIGLEASGVAATPAPAAPAAPAVENAEDKGTRDPADFPRVEGVVRTASFTGRNKAGTTESATYTSARPLDELVVAYEKALAEAGWEQINRLEAGNKGSRTLVLSLKKATRSAQVSFIQSKSGGTDLSVGVSERK